MSKNAIPFLSPEVIEARVNHLLAPFRAQRAADEWLIEGWSFDRVFTDHLKDCLGVELDESEDLGATRDGKLIRGCFVPSMNKAYISKAISDSPWLGRSFVGFHEVAGHAFLHGEMMRDRLSDNGPDRWEETDETLSVRTAPISAGERQSLEYQANMAAGIAAAPSDLLRLAFRSVIKKQEVCFQPFKVNWVNGQGLVDQNVLKFASRHAGQIASAFPGLSRICLGRRLIATGLVKEEAVNWSLQENRLRTSPPSPRMARVMAMEMKRLELDRG